jgi:glutathione S-transferase
MGIKFYFAPFSTAFVTTAVLAELEHGRSEPIAERVEVSLQNGDTRTEQYLTEVNPNGMVPAIVHDGVQIWESSAITMYLGENFGVEREVDGAKAPSLYPPPSKCRGEAMKWITWANVRLGTEGGYIYALQQGTQSCVDKVCFLPSLLLQTVL